MARTRFPRLDRVFGEEPRTRALLFALFVVTAAGFGLGCTPSIGDKCVLSTDCSTRGDRLCDTSQPNGYCTIFNCRGDLCPDEAACVLFNAGIQGCTYDDRTTSRTGRTFCMAQCTSNSDCRDGYVCADPRQPPWSAVILDDDQLQLVCIVPPDNGVIGGLAASLDDAGVCSASNPPVSGIDASPVLELPDSATTPEEEAGAEAGTDAGFDATVDSGGADAADAGVLDAADAGG